MLPPKGNTMDPNKKANFEIDPKNLIMPLTVSHGHCQDVGGLQSPSTVSHMKGPTTIFANAKNPKRSNLKLGLPVRKVLEVPGLVRDTGLGSVQAKSTLISPMAEAHPDTWNFPTGLSAGQRTSLAKKKHRLAI